MPTESDDFIMTLDSDPEDADPIQHEPTGSDSPSSSPEPEPEPEPELNSKKSKGGLKSKQKIKEPLDMSKNQSSSNSKKRKIASDPTEEGLDLDENFQFDLEGDDWGFDKVNRSQEWDMSVKGGKGQSALVSVKIWR